MLHCIVTSLKKRKHIASNVLTFMWSMPMYTFILCNAFFIRSLFCVIVAKLNNTKVPNVEKQEGREREKRRAFKHTHSHTYTIFIWIFILVYGIEKLLKFSSYKQNIFNKIREANIFEILSVWNAKLFYTWILNEC